MRFFGRGKPATETMTQPAAGRKFSGPTRRGAYTSGSLSPGGYHRGLRESATIASYAATTYPVLGTPAGVQIIGLLEQAVSGLPVVLQRESDGKPVAHPPAWITRPGGPQYPEITFPTILKHVTTSLLLEGVAYAAVKRDGDGEIYQICPLDPISVFEQVTGDGKRTFTIRTSHIGNARYTPSLWGFSAGAQLDIDQIMIWSGGISIPGVARAVSPFDLIRDVVVIGLEAQKYARRHYESNVGNPTVMTVSDQIAGKDKIEQNRFVEDVEDDFRGEARDVFKLFVAPGAPSDHMHVAQAGLTPAESDTTGIQEYAMGQLAMAVGVPLALIGGGGIGGSAYNSLNVLKSHCQSQVVEPLSRLVCDGFQRFLPGNVRLGLDCSAMGRGDIQTMAAVADRAVRIGMLTLDEGRQMMGFDPLPAGQGGQVMVDNARRPLSAALQPEPEPSGEAETAPKTEGRPPGPAENQP